MGDEYEDLTCLCFIISCSVTLYPKQEDWNLHYGFSSGGIKIWFCSLIIPSTTEANFERKY